jgi:senataxin
MTADSSFSCSELRALPVDQHLFCPRDGDDASVYYDEDVANLEPEKSPDALEERKDKIRHAEERKWLALEALTILAFDGDDAKPHQEWLKERFHTLMTSCDVCVRVFHQSRSEWKAKLLEYVFWQSSLG